MHARLLSLSLALVAAVAAAPLSLAAQNDAAQQLPILGGPGGSAFTRACPAGSVMTGVRARVALAIDAIGIKCRPVAANGALGGESDIGTMAGGSGGQLTVNGSCPQGSVIGAMMSIVGVSTTIGVPMFRCYQWTPATRRYGSSVTGSINVLSGNYPIVPQVAKCAQSDQPFVALRGRAGTLVDAVGGTCNEP